MTVAMSLVTVREPRLEIIDTLLGHRHRLHLVDDTLRILDPLES